MQRAVKAAHDVGYTHILHVGDLAVLWPGQIRFTDRLIHALWSYGMTLMFIDGNHDVHPKLRELPLNKDGFGIVTTGSANPLWNQERLLYISRGHRWAMEGVRFGGLGGAYSIDRFQRVLGKSWWAEEETTKDDVDRLGRDALDVLLTHEVPNGIDLHTMFRLPESIERAAKVNRILVADAVRNTSPKNVFSGHWHQFRTQTLAGSPSRVTVLDMNGRDSNMVSFDLETQMFDLFSV